MNVKKGRLSAHGPIRGRHSSPPPLEVHRKITRHSPVILNHSSTWSTDSTTLPIQSQGNFPACQESARNIPDPGTSAEAVPPKVALARSVATASDESPGLRNQLVIRRKVFSTLSLKGEPIPFVSATGLSCGIINGKLFRTAWSLSDFAGDELVEFQRLFMEYRILSVRRTIRFESYLPGAEPGNPALTYLWLPWNGIDDVKHTPCATQGGTAIADGNTLDDVLERPQLRTRRIGENQGTLSLTRLYIPKPLVAGPIKYDASILPGNQPEIQFMPGMNRWLPCVPDALNAGTKSVNVEHYGVQEGFTTSFDGLTSEIKCQVETTYCIQFRKMH